MTFTFDVCCHTLHDDDDDDDVLCWQNDSHREQLNTEIDHLQQIVDSDVPRINHLCVCSPPFIVYRLFYMICCAVKG